MCTVTLSDFIKLEHLPVKILYSTCIVYRSILIPKVLGSQCNQDSGILQVESTIFVLVDIHVVTARFCNNPVKYFMLLRGVPLSENICNENIQIMMSCHHIEYMRLSY